MHPLIPLALATQMMMGNPGITALNQGARAIDRNDIAEGLELTRQALESEFLLPDQTAKAHNNLCVAFYKLKLHEEALKHCNKAISITRHNWAFFTNRANVNLGLGFDEEALADYQRALDLNPGSRKVEENLRMAVRLIGREKESSARPGA